jgi:hypothetical protein
MCAHATKSSNFKNFVYGEDFTAVVQGYEGGGLGGDILGQNGIGGKIQSGHDLTSMGMVIMPALVTSSGENEARLLPGKRKCLLVPNRMG